MKRLDLLVACVLFTAIGGTAGWISSEQARDGSASGHGHSHGPSGSTSQQTPILSDRTLANLGVHVAQVRPTDYQVTRDVPAQVTLRPTSARPVHAPVGGRIQKIFTEPGKVMRAGAVLMTLLREPIPRPRLTLTEEFLKPAEEIHEAVVGLRTASSEIEILKTELQRVKAFAGNGAGEIPVIPRQTLIDLEYKLRRAHKAHELAEHELEKHGFTEAQVTKIGAGEPLPILGVENWRRALKRNGLWPDAAERLFTALPTALQRMPWALATVGELSAGGLISEGLLSWFGEIPDDCEHFLDIASLLQQGHSVADIRALHALGGLDPIVQIKAPSDGEIPNWDVVDLAVRPGATVPRGAPLITLLDLRRVRLETAPVGADQSDVLKLLVSGEPIDASPLVAGSGPELEGIRLAFAPGQTTRGGSTAIAEVDNTVLVETGPDTEPARRTWALRTGLRYMLKIPVRKFTDVFTVPEDALTSDAGKTIVFARKGLAFEALEVKVLHRGDGLAVLANDDNTKMSPERHIALRGAYALGLAMKGRQSSAGHGHTH